MNKKIILVDINKAVTDAFEKHFADLDNFEVKLTSIFELNADLVVSPANSFGFLNGGIDGLYTDVIGPQVQQILQNKIKEDFNGELLIGQSVLIETQYDKIPYLIASPTMRLPTYITNTINVYLAAKATFDLIHYGGLPESVNTIAMPGFGTATGRMNPMAAAHQMKKGYLASRDKWFPNSLSDVNRQIIDIKQNFNV